MNKVASEISYNQKDAVESRAEAIVENIEESPLTRINADNQDPRLLCCQCSLFVAVSILIFLLKLALPPNFKHLANEEVFKKGECTNPYAFQDQFLYCSNFSSANPRLGLVMKTMFVTNQFALIFLEFKIRQKELQHFKINQNVTLNLYEISVQDIPPSINAKRGQGYKKQAIIYNQTVELQSGDYWKQYPSEERHDQKETASGYAVSHDQSRKDQTDFQYRKKLLVMAQNFPVDTAKDYFFRIEFSNPEQLKLSQQSRIQGFSITSSFTKFILIIRYVYLGIGVIVFAIFLRRFCQLPAQKRTLHMKLVVGLSVAAVLFNDPFYTATILSPNPFTTFLSVMVVANYLVALMAVWVFFLIRILDEEGQQQACHLSVRSSWGGIAYFVVLYVLIVVYNCLLAYQIASKEPIIVKKDVQNKTSKVFGIILLAVLCFGMFGIVVLYIKCLVKCYKSFVMWRDKQFLMILPLFLAILVGLFIAGATMSFSYESLWILYGYSFCNIFAYVMQYLYYTPADSLQRINNLPDCTSLGNLQPSQLCSYLEKDSHPHQIQGSQATNDYELK